MCSPEYDLSSIKGIIPNDIENCDNHKYTNFINTRGDYKLIHKNWVKNNITYEIIKYDKTLLTYDIIDKMGIFRSVITHKNKLLCFSPPKSYNINLFMIEHSSEECFSEEMIEGTMINLFFDKNINNWEIATKSSVGGNVTFHKEQPMFSELFYEICTELGVDFNNFNKEYCYSFVMQHPQNKFVLPLTEKKLYLIAVYHIDTDLYKITEIPKYQFINQMGKILLPQIYNFTSYDELIYLYGSMNTPIHIMGIMIYNKNGQRTKLRNPNYEYVKHLKGNSTKLQYQYLCLRKLGQVKDNLRFFPENKTKFSVFKEQLHLYTNNLYTNYIKCYIKKEQQLKEFPHQFKTHMYDLHQHYLSIKPQNGYINKVVVINYINNLDSARLMYVLNYHLRELTTLTNCNSMEECETN